MIVQICVSKPSAIPVERSQPSFQRKNIQGAFIRLVYQAKIASGAPVSDTPRRVPSTNIPPRTNELFRSRCDQ
ncbi:hypothetical protein Dda3937_04418 [Dickeya dadantii 3937]|uniref:Uncharacterized protein n=1 Tax=Dickeya dadantii (strain 3937) TaxID=198628 RepID=E0SKL4_DICD3|nr:hypothetical protein Dda3937_04418 [Dickeya dadantii 3937]